MDKIGQKDLTDSNMNFYVALISEADGLDAMGPMHLNYSDIYTRELAAIVLPLIFTGKIKRMDSGEFRKARNAASAAANKIADSEGTRGDETLKGILMRKEFAQIQGEIVLGPIDKDFADKIRGMGGWKGAKTFVLLATHIIKKSSIVRISEDERQDLIDEIKSGMAFQEAKAKRAARKQERGR